MKFRIPNTPYGPTLYAERSKRCAKLLELKAPMVVACAACAHVITTACGNGKLSLLKYALWHMWFDIRCNALASFYFWRWRIFGHDPDGTYSTEGE